MKNVGGVATSQAAATPWVSITRDAARTACSNLGAGYSLITNDQWQAIARNIEQVAANWSGGVVGSGSLNRGHSDNSPNSALVADTDDANGCYGTDQSCPNGSWHEQKRTHLLSNGEVIWDFAGNVREWVKDDKTTLAIYTPELSIYYLDYPSITNVNNRKYFAPSNPAWGYTQGMGVIAGVSGDAILRGGYWGDLGGAGVFYAHLEFPPSSSSSAYGFRCTFVP